MEFSIYQASRIGGRNHNQDRVAYAYSNESLLMVLADGMGGHSHGEMAAQLTLRTYTDAFRAAALPRVAEPAEFLRTTMQRAHQAILQYARERELGGNPGTTCVAALVQNDSVCWAHAGDSRLYLVRDHKVLARTHDHSVVQQWRDWGLISAEEMKHHPDRNKITNCLGGAGDLFHPESSAVVPLRQGDVLLLCSDGLWNPLAEAEILNAFRRASLAESLEWMMDAVARYEGARSDNVTAVAMRYGDGGEPHPTPVPVTVMLDNF